MTQSSKPIVFAIVGDSGSGKTTAVEYTSQLLGTPVLRSYTTRPMRPGERQGVEHIFVEEWQMPNRHEMIAYTCFGNYHYWATRKQVDGQQAIMYVIDEVGLQELIGRFEKIYDIVPIYIECPNKPWMKSEADRQRAVRDLHRNKLPSNYYYQIIRNDGEIDSFLHAFARFIQQTINHPAEVIQWCRNRAGINY